MTLGKMNWQNLPAYTVQPTDMELFQTYVNSMSNTFMNSSRTEGVLFGGRITTVSGMQLKLSSGAAIMPDGSLITWPDTNFIIPTANPSNARIDRIELAYTPTNNTGVTNINGGSLTLDILYVPSVVINSGTASATPVAPSKTSTNVSLGFISVAAAASSILLGNISQVEDTNFESSSIHLGNKSAFIRMNQSQSKLQYSTDGVLWSAFGSGGGGGGGGANWVGADGVAPVSAYENGEKVLLYSQGAFQSASLFVKVPSGYLSGSPIKMHVGHYGPGTSNNYKFQAVVTLIRKNTDAITSTTNQYTSTNGDVVNTVANLYTDVLYDLSTSLGVIGSVGVSAGDLLLVTLTRITPTGTEDSNDVRMIPSTTEILFS